MLGRALTTSLLLTLPRWAHASGEVCAEAEHDDEAGLLAVRTAEESSSGTSRRRAVKGQESACTSLFKTCANLHGGTPTCSEGATAPDGHHPASKCTQGEATCYSYRRDGGDLDSMPSVGPAWAVKFNNYADGIGVFTFSEGCTTPTTTASATTAPASAAPASTTPTASSESTTNEWA